MTDSPVTRADIEALWRVVSTNEHRLDAIDTGGTRGVGALSVQITEVVKDVSALQVQMREFQREHEELHRREASARIASRRWAIATAVAFLAAIEGPLIYLVQLH
jgi:hypothetical protein